MRTALLLALLLSLPLYAAEAEAAPRPTAVAILAFDNRLPGSPQLGTDMAEVIAALLGDVPGYSFVERTALTNALQEHQLALTGMVEGQTAAKVGRLVGAELLVSGKAFPLGEKVVVSMKVVGTDTGLMEAALIEEDAGTDLAVLVKATAAKLGQVLREKGSTLVAHPVPVADPVPALAERFAQRAPVTIAVAISESHIAARRVPDPAAETEVKLLAAACGVRIKDIPANALVAWMSKHQKGEAGDWPAGFEDVEYVLVGEAFSEGGPLMGELRTCLARVEVNLIRRADGTIVGADRANTRAVDVAEFSAGKKALQAAGREIGLRCLDRLVSLLPARAAAP